MGTPQVVRELKRDGLGRVELVRGQGGLAVRRIACGGRLPLSGAVARWLMGRERRALERLEAQPGVAGLVRDPELVALASPDGRRPRAEEVLLRTWLEGDPLWSVEQLPRDFFELLVALVERLHEQGVCHNDLHKEPNVLVGPDGRPGLIDFQLASVHPGRSRSFENRRREDLRHVHKHRRRYEQRGVGRYHDEEGQRRSFGSRLWRRTGKRVYNWVTRGLLRRPDGEPRRPREGPWPRWTEAVGPAPAALRTDSPEP